MSAFFQSFSFPVSVSLADPNFLFVEGVIWGVIVDVAVCFAAVKGESFEGTGSQIEVELVEVLERK